MTIVVLRGLPGSGKSTWAREYVALNPDARVRVNRDDIRAMLFGRYDGVDEKTVSQVEEATVLAAVEAGRDVVVDAMHLRT